MIKLIIKHKEVSIAVPLLKELRERVPVVFDDLEPMEWETVK